jgi:nicotinamidase-related amidase
VHCVQGTEGAQFVEGLELGGVDVFIEKGQEKLVESYSAFTDPWGLFPSKLEEELKDRGITDLFVVGLGMFLGLRKPLIW